ncbi:uncharacterized protein LOC120117064 [Hibiscus syriacus]|uniref:uncharacterized protein LOC120117064 n=1 Tax=Hibiscus syriacus TaxID=106335 RepID=UPI00192232C5|nr:uncharacterized protein LOC120117064 [Hibiscus syriacus]
MAMASRAISFFPHLSISPPRHSFTPIYLPSSHRFLTFSPRPIIQIQCATKDNKEATPPASAPPTQSFDPKKGVALYKPKSYDVLVTDAANSLAYAIQDGQTRLEIDFPYVFYHSLNLRFVSFLFGFLRLTKTFSRIPICPLVIESYPIFADYVISSM